MKDQAVEKGLVKPKRKSFWQREIKPIFGVYHGSSSDDEDDPKAVKAKEKAARKEARREKRNAKEQVEEKMRMFHEERSKEDARDIVTKTVRLADNLF